VLLPLAGLFAFCGQLVQVYIDTLPSPSLSGAGSGYLQSLDFIGFHASLFNSEYSLLTIGVLAFLPAAVALFVALGRTDVGISAVGAILAGVGVVFILIAAVDAFTQIQEAVIWDSGCTPCGTTPINLSYGSSTYGAALQLGDLLVVVSVLVFSVLMLRGNAFSKFSGVLGIVSSIYVLANGFLLSSNLSEINADIVTAIAFLLITLWAFSLAPRLVRLGKTETSPPQV